MDTLPKRIPETLDELQLAIEMLGHVAKGQNIKRSRKDQLAKLLGSFPKAAQAQEWKRLLKNLAKEMRELGEDRV